MVYSDEYPDFVPLTGGNPEAQPGTFKGFFLVRDSAGKPRFDDIFNIAPEFWSELTTKEQEIILQERQQLGNYS